MRVSDFGTFGICLDKYSAETFEGRLYVPYFEEALIFKSIHSLLLQMNKALDAAGVPHPFFEYRSFSEAKVEKKEKDNDKKENLPKKTYDHGQYAGKIATFLVNILYRQNATWQGTITWVEGEKSDNFRSALELFMLAESVI